MNAPAFADLIYLGAALTLFVAAAFYVRFCGSL
jgi:hypothetical protein